MNDMKEFVAYSKKPLRVLKKIKSPLQNKDYADVEKLVKELIEDTIQALQNKRSTKKNGLVTVLFI